VTPVRIVAHRGASLYAPDNTLTAFRLAKEMGAEMIETDIRRSADGKIVVYHDSYVPVPGGCDVHIEHTALDDLLRIPLAKGEHIPRFENMVALCRELNLGMYIEFKDTTDEMTAEIIDILRQMRMLDQSILFGSRIDHVVTVKLIDPKVRTCFSYRQPAVDPIQVAQVTKADGLNLAWEDYPEPHTKISPEWLKRVRGAGLRIMSWHEERASELAALVALGIDDICTNDPALAHNLRVAHGDTK
jgi:glycerophosphoryl diester phosphodiesterase